MNTRRPGRPPLDPESETVRLHVRVTAKDYDAAYQRAREERQTMADWFRETLRARLVAKTSR